MFCWQCGLKFEPGIAPCTCGAPLQPPEPERGTTRRSGRRTERKLAVVVGAVAVVVVAASVGVPTFLKTRTGESRAAAEADPVKEAKRQEAIQCVQSGKPTVAPLLQLFGMGGGNNTWKELLEARALAESGSLERYRWTATDEREGLRDGEWLVSFVDENGGTFFLVHLISKRITPIIDDPVAARRVGLLRNSPNASLRLTTSYVGVTRCGPGACFAVRGEAENLGPPIIGLDAETKFFVTIADRTTSGEAWWGQERDRFRRASTTQPWATGDVRTFEYLSDRIPDVYATEDGSAVGYFGVRIETVSRGRQLEFYEVHDFDWPSGTEIIDGGAGTDGLDPVGGDVPLHPPCWTAAPGQYVVYENDRGAIIRVDKWQDVPMPFRETARCATVK